MTLTTSLRADNFISSKPGSSLVEKEERVVGKDASSISSAVPWALLLLLLAITAVTVLWLKPVLEMAQLGPGAVEHLL